MAFINKILVPTDFSAPSVNALKYAVTLAEKTQAQVIVLHVYNVPVVDPYMPGDTMEALLQEVERSARESMQKLLAANSYTNLKGVCELGFATDNIISFAGENAIDLIVIGTTGASGLKEVFFGSNAAGVMQRSSIKVLAIPGTYQEDKVPGKICYASDFTGNEELQFQTFIDIAKEWDCSLCVLHVVNDDTAFTRDLAKSTFDSLARNSDFYKLHFEEIHSHDVTAAIETYVQATHADILALTVHQRNLFERLFNKSKTRQIAHHAHIPLLTVRKH